MIIGLMGNAGVGKDTVADMMKEFVALKKISFADPMKRFVREMFDFSVEQVYGPKEIKETPDPRWDGLTPRKALQLLGTEWGRACHPEVWTRFAIRHGMMAVESGWYVVIPDCRFMNEYHAVKQAGGRMVRIYRPGFEGDSHRSETEQKTLSDGAFDFMIHNTGTLDDLRLKVIEMLETWP